ncbi:methyl-accepting chemotaxis protein [Gracilibacillus salinarum]|uniref:HAMP domain-containing methyl-accepting chemotaxis protein n=1 Tax=Gracilibacillus salinarum TaxID=2932255 RepID=A0ABY4GL99_9BACI|nr:HAMP domain-containing methyl-accepting chemotaxis protein [Gracilibacillus salinarum]UOQ85150.1 HAMP domain-containing methyl-accepting chemotaxis protein [Gracilibacillus salinarum]
MMKNKAKRQPRRFRLKNMKIGRKYGLIQTIILLLFLGATIYVSMLLQTLNSNMDVMRDEAERVATVTELDALIREKGEKIYEYMYQPDKSIVDTFTEVDKQTMELRNSLQPSMDTAEELELFNTIAEMDDQISTNFQKIVDYHNEGSDNNARIYADQAGYYQSITVENIAKLKEIADQTQATAIQHVNEDKEEVLYTLIISFAVAFIVGFVLFIIMNRHISRNIQQVISISNQIAAGDLRAATVAYDGKDEIGQLAQSVNRLGDNLRQIVSKVATVSDTVSQQSEVLSHSAGEVRTGTEQIASTMQELASGSETQANHAGSVAAKMNDFSLKVQEANENGRHIESSSTGVLTMTKDGQQMMESSVQQMGRVHSIVQASVEKVRGLDVQTKEISQLVAVIKDIAEQTNLLALNAAIESARAGEHGKGFAVVADEVRKLAEQVAHSVTDITTIVNTIQAESSNVTNSLEEGYSEVTAGSEQIKQTGSTFEQINAAVSEMVDTIRTVTTNLSDMTSSSEQINIAVEEIASISEESAAGVEQTSASAQQASSAMEEVSVNSKDLSLLAEELNEAVKQFKL